MADPVDPTPAEKAREVIPVELAPHDETWARRALEETAWLEAALGDTLITVHYTPDQLVGRKVAAVVNFPPRQIGPFMSEVLTLGFPDDAGEVVLVGVDRDVPVGGRLF